MQIPRDISHYDDEQLLALAFKEIEFCTLMRDKYNINNDMIKEKEALARFAMNTFLGTRRGDLTNV